MSLVSEAPLRPWVTLVLTAVYTLAAAGTVAMWAGLQSFDPAQWRLESLPYYALIFLLGAGSGWLLVLARRRWAAYGLFLTWLTLPGLGILFPTPLRFWSALVASVLALASAWEIRQHWQELH